MTASAAGLALIPLMISGDIPGQEIEYPMAIVILGGLVTSTVLNLFIVPSLYLRFAPKRSRAEIAAGSALASMTPDQMAGAPHNGDPASSTKERSGSVSASMTPDQMAGAPHNGDPASSAQESSGSVLASMTPDQMAGTPHNGDPASSAQRRKPDAV